MTKTEYNVVIGKGIYRHIAKMVVTYMYMYRETKGVTELVINKQTNPKNRKGIPDHKLKRGISNNKVLQIVQMYRWSSGYSRYLPRN